MRNLKYTKLTLNQLLLTNSHIGFDKEYFNVKVKPFLLGTKGYNQKIFILDLSFTLIQFKILINNIVNIISLRQKIFIVKNNNYFSFEKLFLNLKNVLYWEKKWIGGVLTNHRVIRKTNKLYVNHKYKKKLVTFRYIPSLLFLVDINFSKWTFLEALNMDIPIAAIVNSNSSFLNDIDYPIVGNNQVYESVFLYLSVIKNSVKKGYQKERLKILRIL